MGLLVVFHSLWLINRWTGVSKDSLSIAEQADVDYVRLKDKDPVGDLTSLAAFERTYHPTPFEVDEDLSPEEYDAEFLRSFLADAESDGDSPAWSSVAHNVSDAKWPTDADEIDESLVGLRLELLEKGTAVPGQVIECLGVGSARVHFDRHDVKWDKTYTLSNFEHPNISPLYATSEPRDRVTSKLYLRHGDDILQALHVTWCPDWSCARSGARILSLLEAQGEVGEARDFAIRQDTMYVRHLLGLEAGEDYVSAGEKDRGFRRGMASRIKNLPFVLKVCAGEDPTGKKGLGEEPWLWDRRRR